MVDRFCTRTLNEAPTVTAPDGSTVRPLCTLRSGSFAHFQLEPGEVAKAVSHATVEEIWYVIAGTGEMWRQQGDESSVVQLHPGVCLTIPLGTMFQFRAGVSNEPLQAIAVTIPPWPVDNTDEARIGVGPWTPFVGGQDSGGGEV
jgi:mannose-6-phosphate isomerase-like protein (cupin superfamily)